MMTNLNLKKFLGRLCVPVLLALAVWAVMLSGCATQPAYSDSGEITQGPIQPVKTPPGR